MMVPNNGWRNNTSNRQSTLLIIPWVVVYRKLEQVTEHLLSKMSGNKGKKGWLINLYKCVVTLNMKGTKGMSTWDRFLCFCEGSKEDGIGEAAGRTLQFLPTSPELFYKVVPGLGLELWVLESGIISKQETIIIALNLYARILKGLMGWIMPCTHLEKLRLTVTAATLPGVQNSPYLCIFVTSPCMNGTVLKRKHFSETQRSAGKPDQHHGRTWPSFQRWVGLG